MVVAEGASTMDISRQVINNSLPRHRLDAGTWGTMGVGLPQAIAAQLAHPDQRVVDIEGDSAFGFSGMEVEVACRLKLPITFVVINNNGVGGGPTSYGRRPRPARRLLPGRALREGHRGLRRPGHLRRGPARPQAGAEEGLGHYGPSVINVTIWNESRRRAQQFGWHTR